MKKAAEKMLVAIIGSGPAGFYSADRIFKKSPVPAAIDMFDFLPTPHGLVRQGVAPDHQRIKSVSKVYDKIASHPDFRFFGLVEFGKDIFLDDLKKRYHQIIFATGAQTDKKMKIPGENLPGSCTATDFVAWYNGHPYASDLDFDMSCERAVIIGVGNVAVDVARILCQSRAELLKTDIADYALEKLASSSIKEIFIVGRRGPAQAAFTNPELKELCNLEDADVVTCPEEMEIDPLTRDFLEKNPNTATQKKLEILRGFSVGVRNKKKKLHLRFLLSPVSINGDENNRASSVTFTGNKLVKREDGSITAVGSDETEKIDAGLIFRSIGYRGIALKDVPFDEKAGVIPNENGRVLDKPGGKPVEGLYTAGWIKRGATGIIGTNKADSTETVDIMIEDFSKTASLNKELTASPIEELLEKKKGGLCKLQKMVAAGQAGI